MILKAIVESYPENNKIKVRIPKFHKLDGVVNATPFNDLPSASILCLPGIIPHYIPNDIVFVGFENEDISRPIILGKLYRQDDFVSSTSTITASELTVTSRTNLSSDTQIGNVNYEDLNYSVNGFINLTLPEEE